VSWVALMNFVVSAALPNFTVAPETKPAPFTVRVKLAPPAAAELGLRLVIAGRDLIVNVDALEAPPVVVTVTLAVPAVAIRFAGTAALSVVALTKLVCSAAPCQFTFAPET